MARTIPLLDKAKNVRAHAIVDDDIYESAIRRGPWRFSSGYVKTNKNSRGPAVYLHRFVLGLKPGDPSADHRDRDPLNCQRGNLRIAGKPLNSQNQAPEGRGTSGARGVTWMRSRNKWRARAMLDYKEHHIGLFEDFDEAVQAVKNWRAEHMPYAEEG